MSIANSSFGYVAANTSLPGKEPLKSFIPSFLPRNYRAGVGFGQKARRRPLLALTLTGSGLRQIESAKNNGRYPPNIIAIKQITKSLAINNITASFGWPIKYDTALLIYRNNGD
jgi:hypothetical protein